MMGLVNLREQEEKPKAIIMAGGAGVGKTFVTDKFKKAAESKGWVVLNPDQYARNPDPEQRLSLAAAASKINKEVDSLAKSEDKPNIIWDTTANNPTKVKELQDAGYDVLMIMVYAHPSVAFEQNFARASKEGEDSLPPYVILKTWADSYNDPHIENYQKMFGDNFIIIDNTSKPGTDNSKIDAFNKAAQQGGKALEKYIGDVINSDPEYYESSQMVSKPADLSKEQQADFNFKIQELGLKLEEDDREAMEKLYQKYFEKNNEVMPLKKVGRKNGMEEVYKSYMSKKVKKDTEKDRVYSDISSTIKNVGKSFLSIDDATSKAMAHIGQKKINELTQFLVDGILNEEYKEVVALFGGGFKPPTKGHLEVILQGLKLAPEINNLKIIVGGGVRDGITQKQSKEIWEIYDDANLIPISNVEIIEASPFKYLKDYLKNHTDDKTYVFIGSRDGNDGDKADVEQRSKYVKNYSNNVIPLEVSTGGSVSGTEARKLLKTDLDGFRNMLPANLTQGEVDKIVDILNGKSTNTTPKPTSNKTEPLTPLNENATYSSKIDYKQQIKDLTKHMIKKGMNILPLPKVIFKHGDQENASQFLGKTAYYSPSDMTVVLYTEGRHPKDIVRSFAHEMVHHIQNIEDRLENISTTNTMEDDNLNDIEREAYTKGNMTFRNWTDSLDGEEVTSLNEKIVGEKIECDNCGWSWNIVDGGDDLFICHKCDYDNEPENGDPFGLKAYARELMEDFNIEDIKPPVKSLEEQKEVRIFTTNCGCDKT